MKKKSRSMVIGNKQVNSICEACTEKEGFYVVKVRVDDIKLRPTGYKGRFQAYTKCNQCEKEIVLPEASMTNEVFKYLLKKWDK